MILSHKILLVFFCFSISLFAQNKTNLEIINDLVDSSKLQIVKNLDVVKVDYKFQSNSPQEYSSLNHRIVNSLVRSGIKINEDSAITNNINYSLSHVGVNYSNLFKDGLFGDYLMERKIILSGDFSIQKSEIISNANVFYFSVTDTILYENYNSLENSSLPFSKGNVPDPPFFPSILEPVVAITAIVASVILFFSVRTK